MNISDAAKRSGLTTDTIRFYEREGVVPPPPRRQNRYRDYGDEHVSLLGLAATLRDLGLPLHDVGQVVAVVRDGSCEDAHEALIDRLSEPLREIEARLQRLRDAREQLAFVVEDRGLPALPT